ncbi:ATP-dependent DNA ligase LigD phosphoesterase module /ATP-dependent DNA ligase LigD polymerase module [Pseudoxanthomonas sp. GM95]|uniref:DNA ligase D n=1 Tax=Pseudoxanthomonas sp. GM95 TaxID=1881043 RepID=UPI0008B4E33C|nr:DNA ligase D [Pseudoxanthomonas sp. GM95]SEM08112.1 ATP-dependent DNA ligase LigD phosphoesterase module /ATP-dependent DNA ligase LigD polymerase module [Pseudoxanthomonas sp. GM95]
MSLHEYDRKRRFGQTPEPRGGQGGRAGHRPIFIVQLHHASSRHYDFRLEADGVLKSWAVPKGPSLRAGEKRLAVEVEDHPLDYASFEGDIPKGHYGAGHVDVFDHGHWTSDGEPLAAIAAGKLDFILSGDKLGGAWKLVRTQMKGRQKQWLLIKRDDAFATDQEADDLLDAPATAAKARKRAPTTTKRATPRKAPAAPRKRTKAEAAWKRRVLALEGARDTPYPAGYAAQLCKLRAVAPAGEDWLHEIKWDGYRLLADLVDGEVKLRSRNGLDWNDTFPEIVAAVRALPVRDARLDGELVVIDAQGRSDFSALQRTIDGTVKAQLRYLVFDLPGVAGVDISRAPLVARKALLKALLGDAPGLIAFSDHVLGHGSEVFSASAKAGLEGIVSKRADSAYTGARSDAWVKVKHEQTDEFVIVGYTPPKGARTGFGSLLMARVEHGALVYAGRVGTGYDDATLKALLARLKLLHSERASIELPAHVPFNARSVHWVKPQLLAEVAFRGWGKEGLLRQAAFKRLREDKDMAALHNTADGAIIITHPDRVVYPKDKITKGQVADYYRRIASLLLPELAGRPLSLLRCPDGAGNECFFQKHHAPSLGKGVHAVPLKQKSGTEDYLYVEDIEGVLALVQMNTLELHPWGSTVDAPEQPDRLVFDLDPGPGVSWAQVKQAAREIRSNLRKTGLESFVRLSGGKGLHVVVPIDRGPSWDTVKAFCEAFANAMAEHRPERYIATMSKAKRERKIFIDWLRNGRGSTSVCSWSLRAREHATVAVPLRWDDLGRITGPGQFTLDKALQRAARLKADPWKDMAILKQKLPQT